MEANFQRHIVGGAKELTKKQFSPLRNIGVYNGDKIQITFTLDILYDCKTPVLLEGIEYKIKVKKV